MLISGCNRDKITEQEAEKIARNTEEVKFLEFYGKCEDCSPAYSENQANLIGCVEYAVSSDLDLYTTEYCISDACYFRYGSSLLLEKIRITIGSGTGAIVSKYPSTEYINNPDYCKKVDDCLCKSGSGFPFFGCGNFLHAPTYFAGSYKCERCQLYKWVMSKYRRMNCKLWA